MISFKNDERPGTFEMWQVSDNTVYFKHIVEGVIKREEVLTLEESKKFRTNLETKGWKKEVVIV